MCGTYRISLPPAAVQVLIELEPAPHQATELSGDAGAVGRLVASSSTGIVLHMRLQQQHTAVSAGRLLRQGACSGPAESAFELRTVPETACVRWQE
jgi:hypothetical protein